jgi:prevent-host-death family protein
MFAANVMHAHRHARVRTNKTSRTTSHLIQSGQADYIQEDIMQTWQLQEAKGKFSEVVKRAQSQGPQNITVHGEPVAVLISRRDYLKLTHPKPSLVELLRASPLVGNDLKITREQTPTRKIKL